MDESNQTIDRINDTAQSSGQKKSLFKRILCNITVEPMVICWLFPFLLTYASIENLNLEKACRGLVTGTNIYGKDICKLFVLKDEFNINCNDLTTNETAFIAGIAIDKINDTYPRIMQSILINGNLSDAAHFLCDLEKPVQIKLTNINSIRNPLSGIGPLIIILFAGPWSDKKNLRIPCMIVPYVGECVGYLSLFIAAIFINGPVEFPAYAYRLIPSFTGAENLMIIGIFSYLTVISSDENRTLRFGIFQMFMTIVPIVAQSLSPFMSRTFEYAVLFGSMIPIQILGLAYTLFVLKEPKPYSGKKDTEATTSTEILDQGATSLENIIADKVEEPKNACLEFFDPQLAIQCFRSFLKKRPFGIRRILIILMFMHFITIGVVQGEAPLNLFFQRETFNWDVGYHVMNNVFQIVMGLIGVAFAVGFLSKILKIQDIVLVIISSIFTISAKIIYSLSTSTVMFFIGTATDFTSNVKFLGVKSMISKLVTTEDLGTMYSVLGLFEAISIFVFAYSYPKFFEFLHKNGYKLNHIYQLSAILVSIALIAYIFIFILMRRKNKAEQAEKEQNDNIEISKL